MLEAKIPGCGLKVSPHIESRVKTLKLKYFALTEMLSLSGFGWNEEKMMLVCEKSVYDEWVKSKKEASVLYDKSFPHYYLLGEIYGKDRAVGTNVGNADDYEEEVRHEDATMNHNEGEDDFVENVNMNVDSGSPFEGLDDFDASFAQPNTQQQRPTHSTSSVANNSRNKMPNVVDEMTKQFSSMAQAIARVGPKLDDLVHVLSTEINLTELQEKLHGELSKMEFLTSLQLFKVTNFLAKEHDLLRVFFTMHDESKREYVTTLLQTWEQSGI
ncbi:hypothetical protein L3X38_037686 [Prunus dulcis]|uniref:Myb/SANT-like domain-containing protein n=1 Tax=Prunus dulcis TaxID=3755 RepID=A0AAD4YQX5_PRUDU|nr:hypothetical protein L3X38_037686 [Prunus dulcis]